MANSAELNIVFRADGTAAIKEINGVEQSLKKTNITAKESNKVFEVSRRDFRGLTVDALASSGAFNNMSGAGRLTGTVLQIVDTRALTAGVSFRTLGASIKATIASLGPIGIAITLVSLALQGLNMIGERNLKNAEKQEAEAKRLADIAVKRNADLRAKKAAEEKEAEAAHQRAVQRDRERAQSIIRFYETYDALVTKYREASIESNRLLDENLEKKWEQEQIRRETELQEEMAYQERIYTMKILFGQKYADWYVKNEKQIKGVAAAAQAAASYAVRAGWITQEAAMRAQAGMDALTYGYKAIAAFAKGVTNPLYLAEGALYTAAAAAAAKVALTSTPLPAAPMTGGTYYPAAAPEQAPVQPSQVQNVYIYGSLWQTDQLARELLPSLNKAVLDGVT